MIFFLLLIGHIGIAWSNKHWHEIYLAGHLPFKDVISLNKRDLSSVYDKYDILWSTHFDEHIT